MPVYRASTICFDSLQALDRARAYPDDEISYGIHGTPTVRALQDAVTTLEGGHRAFALPSGLAAISAAILAFAGRGDHILVTDSVYWPTRRLCDLLAARFGIEVDYYDPQSADITALLRANTRLVYAESPGSFLFEMQDVGALARQAHAHGAMVLLDNSWGTPFHFRAFDHGVDVSIHAATKYIGGHSDVMLGLVVVNERCHGPLREHVVAHGLCASPDDCYLALRGLRTLGPRLRQQAASALRVARWLAQHPAVAQVLYPALPGASGHELWRRDFSGAASVFSIVPRVQSADAIRAMVESLRLFAIGASWGGFESLVLPGTPLRSVRPWQGGEVIRLHVGLEDADDLIADLARGLRHLQPAGPGEPASRVPAAPADPRDR